MKKLLILFTALVMCCGCAEKKNDDSEPVEEDITVDEDTAPEEPLIVTYNADDMKEITVPVTLNDGEGPAEVQKIDISSLDFGEKLPVCITADNWTDYYPEDLYSADDDGIDEQEKIQREAMKSPQKGQLAEYTVADGAAYFHVSYDSLCSGNDHSTAFFKYDPTDGKLTELASVDDLSRSSYIIPLTMKYFKGKLYYIEAIPNGDDSVHYGVYSFDTATGEVEIAFDDPAFSDRNAPNYPLDTLVCQNGHLYAVDYTFGEGADVTEQVIYELDAETGEWSEVLHEDISYKPYEIYNGKIVAIDRNESKKICVHTDSYDFVTSYRSAELVYADENEAALLLTDSLGGGGMRKNCTLQVYDLGKNEHYSFDLSELGECTEIEKVSGGYLVTNTRGYAAPVYYLQPDLGMAFTIATGKSKKYERGDIMEWTNNVIRVNDETASAGGWNDIIFIKTE